MVRLLPRLSGSVAVEILLLEIGGCPPFLPPFDVVKQFQKASTSNIGAYQAPGANAGPRPQFVEIAFVLHNEPGEPFHAAAQLLITGPDHCFSARAIWLRLTPAFPQLNHSRFKPPCHLTLEGWPKASCFTRQSPQHFTGGKCCLLRERRQRGKLRFRQPPRTDLVRFALTSPDPAFRSSLLAPVALWRLPDEPIRPSGTCRIFSTPKLLSCQPNNSLLLFIFK
ncbi:hypothetical protein ACOJBM_06535 [Rhizobium beringeri]